MKWEALDSLDGIFVVLKAFIIGQKYPSILITVPALRLSIYLSVLYPSAPPSPPPKARSSQTIPAKKYQERVICPTVSNFSATSFFSLS